MTDAERLEWVVDALERLYREAHAEAVAMRLAHDRLCEELRRLSDALAAASMARSGTGSRRRVVLAALREADGPLRAVDIRERTGLDLPAISTTLSYLKGVGAVTRDGRTWRMTERATTFERPHEVM